MASIYLFDDDQDILIMCGIVLKQRGYEVFSSHVCDDIVERISAVRPDLIIMDNKIPPDGGINATRILKGNPDTAAIPVLFFSANINVEKLSQEAGADEYIQKPFDIATFEATVERMLHPKDGN